MGMTTVPDSCNLFAAKTDYAFALLNNIYTLGAVRNPCTQEILPWGFRSWELYPERIGTSEPAIVARLREGLTFSDGTPLTAADVQFTVEYHREQEPGGAHGTNHYDYVESVDVDRPGGTTVYYFLEEPSNSWERGVLGYPILPAHVWRNVADYSEYDPLEHGGPVGSGPLALADCRPGEWYALEMRPESETPWNRLEHVDWLHDDGPFVDGVRFEVFDSREEQLAALREGEIDLTFEGIEVGSIDAVETDDHLELRHSANTGWNHISFNTRRVPLDDPAFRQLLVTLFDREHVVKDIYEGIGAIGGDYATPAVYESWRPPAPRQADDFDGISLPDLAFPGREGTFQLDESAVEAAREFLLSHPRAEYDYSVAEATTEFTYAPDGKEIRVDGRPLPEVHTDNAGTPVDGPLELMVRPPTDTTGTLVAIKWLSALKRVGIPVRLHVQSFDAMVSAVYERAEFDMFQAGWTNVAITNDHFTRMFSSEGVGSDGNMTFNPMGYDGADDLIFEQRRLFRAEERKPIVKRILATIWNDAPTLVTVYENVLHPVNTRFTGYVDGYGGVGNPQTWLNVRPADGNS